MSDVFISYSRKDKIFMQHLHEAIVAEGRETWVDWEGIPLTADWWAEIQEAIEAVDTFVFVISPDSATSKVCTQEVRNYTYRGKCLGYAGPTGNRFSRAICSEWSRTLRGRIGLVLGTVR